MAWGGLPRRRLDQVRRPAEGAMAAASPSVIRARQVIVFGPNGGIFVYSGAPAHGTLIYSIAAQSGTDPYGNAYPPGATTYLAGTALYTNMNAGGLLFNGGTPIAGINLNQSGANGQLIIQAATDVVLQAAAFVAPSGDTSGITDRTNINRALARGYCVTGATPGLSYQVDQPLVLQANSVWEGGGAVISPAGGFAGAGMLTLASGAVQNTTVSDVTLLDSYTIAGPLDGVHYITSNSVPNNSLRRVICRGFTGYGFYIQATSNSASAHLNDCIAYGNFLDGFLLSSDQLVVNCEAGFNMGHGFHLASGASNVYLANCLAWYSGVNPQTSIWPAAGTSCGYFLEAPTQFSHLVGCHAQQNGLHGYALGATSGTAGFCYECGIVGCGADTNSAYGAGGVGSGIFVSGVQSCIVANSTGGNNGGLSPGSQLWGIQAPGGLVATQFSGNTIFGSSAAPNQIASRWSNLALINGWAAGTGVTPKWSFTDTPPNSVQLLGTLDGAAATSAVFAVMPGSGVGLPVRPASLQMFPLSDTTLATAGQCFGTVDAAGNLSVNCGTLINKYRFQGTYSIDA